MLVNQNLKFVIIGIAVVSVIPLVFFGFQEQEKSSEGVIRLIEAPPDISLDEKLRNFETKNPNADKILSQCGSDNHCAVEALWDLSTNESQPIVLEALSDITTAYNDLQYYCHGTAHHFGMFVFGLTQNMTEALEFAKKRDCGGAMYHGAIENYFLSEMIVNDAKIDEIEFVNICQSLGGDAKKLNRVECAHGTGHGLAKIYDYDIFASVKRCDEFPEAVERRLCYEGVFMENTVSQGDSGGGTFDEKDILFPCNKLDPKYAGACYYYHTSYILQKEGTVDGGFQVCNSVTPEESLKFCYMGIGRQVGGFLFDELEKMVPVCQKGIEEHQWLCYQGALIVIFDQRGLDEGFKACKIFPQDFKKACYTLLGDWIGNETPAIEDREKACSLAENSIYFDICVNARI
jgi:hypothetical protein